MDETQNKTPQEGAAVTPQPQPCTLNIMFLSDSDQYAIDLKKRVQEALSDVPHKRISLTLTAAD